MISIHSLQPNALVINCLIMFFSPSRISRTILIAKNDVAKIKLMFIINIVKKIRYVCFELLKLPSHCKRQVLTSTIYIYMYLQKKTLIFSEHAYYKLTLIVR